MKRFLNNLNLASNEMFEFVPESPHFGSAIVDTSHWQPNSVTIRSAIASGMPNEKGVYDFKDGKDNGFIPASRSLSRDPVDISNAVNSVISNAAEKVENQKAAKRDKLANERAEKILNNLAADKVSDTSKPSSVE